MIFKFYTVATKLSTIYGIVKCHGQGDIVFFFRRMEHSQLLELFLNIHIKLSFCHKPR